MNLRDASFIGVVLVLAIGAYFGLAQFGVPFRWRLAIAVAILLVGAIAWLVLRLVALSRARSLEKGLKSEPAGPGAAGAAGDEMRQQFERYLKALKTSPTGQASLAELPWYLVIGAPGSGKTTALQESGLAFTSLGHGLRSIRGIGGTRNCDWWFADNAILLDTAGRYTTQPEDHGEWLSFLDLVRNARGRRALNGIIVTVAVSDLLKGDPAQISAAVRPIRERIVEVTSRLNLVLPVYVLFTKADLIGGFKDFFAGYSRSQRDQVWGCTIAPDAARGRPARELYTERIAPLIAALQARRVTAIAGGARSQQQLAKLCLMPGNFAALQKWVGEFVGELFAPLPLKDQPLFRGFYFTSGIQVLRPGEKAEPTAPPASAAAGAAGAAAEAPIAADPARRGEMSVFFLPGAEAPPAVEAPDSRRGLFLKDLFARVVIPDRHLAGLPARLVRRARLLRLVAVYGSLALGLVLGALLLSRHIAGQRIIVSAQVAARALLADRADSGRVLEEARDVLAAARAHGGGVGSAIAARLDPLYGARIARTAIQPAVGRIAAELNRLRGAETKGAEVYDRIFDLFRAYRMLTGQTAPDAALLDRLLVDEGLWFSGPAAGDEAVRAAHRHVAYLAGAGAAATGWQARPDTQLIDRVETSLGGALWIQQSFADTVASLQGGTPLGRNQLFDGPGRELIEVEAAVPSLFTPDGWDQEFEPAMPEKVAALKARFAGISIQRGSDELRSRLRTLYGREYNARWFRFMANLRPARCRDLAEAGVRLRQLAGEDSPYRQLAKVCARMAKLDLGDPEVRIALPTDPKWIDEGLTALLEFQSQVERFVQGTQAGQRGKDLARLAEIAAAADKARAACDKAAAALDGEAARTAGQACLGNIIDAVHAALALELGAEQDRAWEAEVAKPFAEQLAGRFPFDPAGAADAPLAPFAKLFNPKAGAVWNRLGAVEKLRAIRWTGRELLPTSLDFQRFAVLARKLSAALFAAGGEDASIALTLKMVQRESVKDMSVAIGKQTFTLYERPDRRYRYEWKAADGGGAKLSLNLATGQWLTKDYPSAGWGVLRMLRDAQAQPRPEGGLALTWTFTSGGRDLLAGGILEESALIDLVGPDFFRTLAMPARVSP